MKKSLWGPLLAIVSAGALGSCGGSSTGPGPTPTPEAPQFPADYATSFVFAADLRYSPDHIGCVQVYCDSAAAQPYHDAASSMPEGTVIVKEIYPESSPGCVNGTGGAAPSSFATMKKLATGASPGTGDWYWQEVDANRNVVKSNDMGNIDACVSCHQSWNNQFNSDYTAIDPQTRL